MQTNLAVNLQRLCYKYPGDTVAIDQISLKIFEGEKVAVIGPNGAGKSTLVMLLNGVLMGEGVIEIFDLALTKKTAREVRSKVGIVFQNPDDQLFCPTVYEDVAFGPQNSGLSKENIQKKVQNALLEVGLRGYETRSSLHLSYGEKKMVSLATVISGEQKLIALDEPTSNLDPFHRRKFIKWIQASSRTVLIATHDLDLVADTVQRVIIIRDGKLVIDGPVENVLTNKELLEQNKLELPLSLQSSSLSLKHYE